MSIIRPRLSSESVSRLKHLVTADDSLTINQCLSLLIFRYSQIYQKLESAGCKAQPTDVEDCTACDTAT